MKVVITRGHARGSARKARMGSTVTPAPAGAAIETPARRMRPAKLIVDDQTAGGQFGAIWRADDETGGKAAASDRRAQPFMLIANARTSRNRR